MEGEKKGKGNKIDRREFLKKLGIAGLGAILGSGKFFKAMEIASAAANPGDPKKPPRLPDRFWDKIKSKPRRYKPDSAYVKQILKAYKAKRYTIIKDGLNVNDVIKAVKIYRDAGIDANAIDSKNITVQSLECDRIYYGAIGVNNSSGVYWFAHNCNSGYYNCSNIRPDEFTHCDIHYEPWITLPNYENSRGLIDFAGCRPAKNEGINTPCRNTWNPCGTNNTLWRRYLCLYYSYLPLDQDSFVIYADYMLSKRPDGVCQKCDCLTWNYPYLCAMYPQVFIVNIDNAF